MRVGLFTPDMAFEVITKNGIEKLQSPAMKCVDMVSNELLTVIKNCADGVGREMGRQRERRRRERKGEKRKWCNIMTGNV